MATMLLLQKHMQCFSSGCQQRLQEFWQVHCWHHYDHP
jgi:hypothetical protein